MRDPNRISIVLNQIEKIWRKHPDLRFCQLVYIITQTGEQDSFYLEDEDFLARLHSMIDAGYL